MSDLLRFGVSIDEELLTSFDELIRRRGYATRSEALRDLVREALVSSRTEADETAQVLGSLTLVYDHHARDLAKQMMQHQHQHHDLVISVLHVHVNHDDCMEVIALRGQAGEVRALANGLLSLKGVKHGALFITLPTNAIVKVKKDKHAHNGHHHPPPARAKRKL